MDRRFSFIRRIIDIIVSVLVLIISSPILLIALIAIKLDSKGPVFFVQERSGYLGKNFKMIKLRGMVQNAEMIGPIFTAQNDNRITPVGKILRRTSIDEIPNFINVLIGDMTLIGPRPELPSITKDYNEYQKQVFRFKPGVTGISQINGRQLLTPEQRVNMEIEYYSKENFISNLKIFLKTFQVVANNSGNI
jgi:lipopolysaccharide/colanic/teichoic acid biosynthesis glycosyltransferase